MKILIADDHALFRDGLSNQIEQIATDSIIFQAGNFSQAFKIIEEEQNLDLVILDLDMPDMEWVEGITEIKKKSAETRFIILSASEDPKTIKKTLEMGVSGYIPKRMETKILKGALQLILNGGSYFPPSIFDPQNNLHAKNKTLTVRQAEVLGFIAQGLSNKQIAYKMSVSEATVKLHVNALLRSVGATNRTQAVIIAQKIGLI